MENNDNNTTSNSEIQKTLVSINNALQQILAFLQTRFAMPELIVPAHIDNDILGQKPLYIPNQSQDDFDKELEKAHIMRMKEQEERERNLEFVGDRQYSIFCAWCNAYRPELLPGDKNHLDIEKMKTTSYVNVKFFREYLDEIKTFNEKLDDVDIKTYILRKFFGYELKADDKGQLIAKKIVKENDEK